MNVDVHIEELILHDSAPGDRERVGAALRRELERLIAERGLSHSLLKGAEISSFDGGTFHAAHGAAAETLGVGIAQAVFGGMQHA